METVPQGFSFHFSRRALEPSVVPENQSPSLFRVQGLLELFSLAHESVRWLWKPWKVQVSRVAFRHIHSELLLSCNARNLILVRINNMNAMDLPWEEWPLNFYDSRKARERKHIQQQDLRIWHQVCPTVIKVDISAFEESSIALGCLERVWQVQLVHSQITIHPSIFKRPVCVFIFKPNHAGFASSK